LIVAEQVIFRQPLEGRLKMRSALTGLFALGALLVPSGAEAALQVRCSWEGRMPVAITVEGDAAALRYSRYYGGGSYYDIAVTRSGVWLLLDEPKPVLSIQLIRPDHPITVVLDATFDGGRCWK
jgi:hypothetical protein